MGFNIDWSKVSRLDDWAFRRYIVLAEEFGDKEFTVSDVEEVLKRKNLQLENVNKLLSLLRREDLVAVKEDPTDFRRSIYRLKLLTAREVKPVGKDDLIRLLKNGADLIRTTVDYKTLLLFLFYKTISDKWHSLADRYIKEYHEEEKAYLLANSEYITLYDDGEKKLYSWHEVTRKRETIKELANALIRVSRMNDKLQDLQKLVDSLGLLSLVNEDNLSILEGLVQLFNKYDFTEADYDTLGDAYQWVLSYFAPTKAKEGETYTPREIIRLIVNILDVDDGSSILDPACGSAAMLIEAYKHVKSKTNKEPSIGLSGQENNEVMAIIAKMNIILHGIKEYEIFVGNSLTNPRFKQADYVIANPPWNQDGYDEKELSNPSVRHIYTSLGINGYTPRTSADWAWVQLMNYYAKKKVGIVIDNGALFRGGREKEIRKAFIEKDLIECVILLPEKLFYNTGAPGAIIILNKNKSSDRRNKVLFINASKEFTKHPEIKKLNILSNDNIRKIVDAYNSFKDIEGLSKVVSTDEIKENDYNLNVTLYAAVLEEKEHIDLKEVYEELNELEEERGIVKRKIDEVMTKLNPFLALFLMLIRALADITNILDDASGWFNG